MQQRQRPRCIPSSRRRSAANATLLALLALPPAVEGVAQLGPPPRPDCPEGSSRSSSIVWTCGRTADTAVFLVTPENPVVEIMVPKGVEQFTASATARVPVDLKLLHDEDLTAWRRLDADGGAAPAAPGPKPPMLRGLLGSASSGLASCSAPRVLRLSADAAGGGGGDVEVMVEYDYRRIWPCTTADGPPQGCVSYDASVASDAARRWSCLIHAQGPLSDLGDTDTAIDSLLGLRAGEDSLAWHLWHRAWRSAWSPFGAGSDLADDLSSEWSGVFRYLDTNEDERLDRDELRAGLALCPFALRDRGLSCPRGYRELSNRSDCAAAGRTLCDGVIASQEAMASVAGQRSCLELGCVAPEEKEHGASVILVNSSVSVCRSEAGSSQAADVNSSSAEAPSPHLFVTMELQKVSCSALLDSAALASLRSAVVGGIFERLGHWAPVDMAVDGCQAAPEHEESSRRLKVKHDKEEAPKKLGASAAVVCRISLAGSNLTEVQARLAPHGANSTELRALLVSRINLIRLGSAAGTAELVRVRVAKVLRRDDSDDAVFDDDGDDRQHNRASAAGNGSSLDLGRAIGDAGQALASAAQAAEGEVQIVASGAEKEVATAAQSAEHRVDSEASAMGLPSQAGLWLLYGLPALVFGLAVLAFVVLKRRFMIKPDAASLSLECTAAPEAEEEEPLKAHTSYNDMHTSNFDEQLEKPFDTTPSTPSPPAADAGRTDPQAPFTWDDSRDPDRQ